MESHGGKIKEMDGIDSLFGLFLLLLHLLISAHETECKDGHDSNQTSSGGHHPRPLCVTQKISNSLRQVITGKKIKIRNVHETANNVNSQWTQRSRHWLSSGIFVPFRDKSCQRRHIKFVKRVSIEFSLTEAAKTDGC